MKRTIPFLCVAVVALFALACGSNDTPPVTGPPPCTSCNSSLKKDLSHKTDVLNNIEYAYNKRNIPTYDELLDDNFTFFFTEPGPGGGTPVQWGRPDEITTTSGLLAAANSIDIAIDWKNGVQWSEQISGSETWYYTTVFYHFTIKIGDNTYIPNNGAKAQFTVRNAGTDAKPLWKLVEFRDLAPTSLVSATSMATEPVTWGEVKALYR